jgi:cbb3-type cytochrome oxidase subunit 3
MFTDITLISASALGAYTALIGVLATVIAFYQSGRNKQDQAARATIPPHDTAGNP